MLIYGLEIVGWVLLGLAVAVALLLLPRFEAWLDELLGEFADGPGR